MLLALVLLFIVLPTVELWLLATLGTTIGWAPTLLIALGTGVLGAALARQQGLATLARITRQMGAGDPPADALVDGAMILVAGAVLITPGVLTDAFGFALLLPPVRAVLKPLLKHAFKRAMRNRVAAGNVQVWSFGAEGPRAVDPDLRSGDVVEGEVVHDETDRGAVIDVEAIEVRVNDK